MKGQWVGFIAFVLFVFSLGFVAGALFEEPAQDPPTVDPWATECIRADQKNCYWDATRMGDGEGESFVVIEGERLLLPPCPTEDSIACQWDAQEQGDGTGRSFFTDADDVVHYIEED